LKLQPNQVVPLHDYLNKTRALLIKEATDKLIPGKDIGSTMKYLLDKLKKQYLDIQNWY